MLKSRQVPRRTLLKLSACAFWTPPARLAEPAAGDHDWGPQLGTYHLSGTVAAQVLQLRQSKEPCCKLCADAAHEPHWQCDMQTCKAELRAPSSQARPKQESGAQLLYSYVTVSHTTCLHTGATQQPAQHAAPQACRCLFALPQVFRSTKALDSTLSICASCQSCVGSFCRNRMRSWNSRLQMSRSQLARKAAHTYTCSSPAQSGQQQREPLSSDFSSPEVKP